MRNFEEMVTEAVYTNPLPLLTINSKRVYEITANLLPYSTGIEIECHQGPNFKSELFSSIPGMVSTNCDNYEQRYRIQPGFAGIIALYALSVQLKLYSQLNLGSGIHYHVDMTGYTNLINSQFVAENYDWVLRELDSWDYRGTYNSRKFMVGKGGWIGARSNTIEFRLGNMTFDYPTLVTQILHANNIVKRFREILGIDVWSTGPPIEVLDTKVILKYVDTYVRNRSIDKKLALIEEKYRSLLEQQVTAKEVSEEEIQQVVKSRIIKL